MFNWFRGRVAEQGVLGATSFLVRIAASRIKVQIANRLFTATLTCPCCGWQGRRFNEYVDLGYSVPNSICPRCESHSRHRFLFLWASEKLELESKSGNTLVFAPEKATESLWTDLPNLNVHRVDLVGYRGVDLLASIEVLPIASDSIDLIWCHHVLEHVEDDREAIRELSRTLRPGTGELVVSVPMEPGSTDEYGFPDPNQSGHWRMYGDDFVDRLTECGLAAKLIDLELSPELLRRHAIEPECFYVCRKLPLELAS